MDTFEQVQKKIEPELIEKVKANLCDECKDKLLKVLQNSGKWVLLNPNAFGTGFFKSLCRKCKSKVLNIIRGG